MKKAEVISKQLEQRPAMQAAYKEARQARGKATVGVPQNLVPIMLLALEHYYSSYELGPDALRDKSVAEGALMAALTGQQSDALALIIGTYRDFSNEYKEAHE